MKPTRIAAIHTHLLHHELDRPFQSAFSQFDSRSHCLIEIACEDGTVGWGECLGHSEVNAAVVSAMAGHLLSSDPGAIRPIWHRLYSQFRDQGQRGAVIAALSGIDIALWDIAGRRRGEPVHALVGGAHRDSVPAYATGGFRVPVTDRATALAEEVAGHVRDGFDAVKIKIGFGVRDDVASVKAAREAVGRETALMVDANHGYDRVEATALGRAVAPLDVAWFEEPVVPEDLDGYRRLRAAQPVPVAGGETWYTRWGFRDAFAADAVDIAQPDVCGCGGLSEALLVAEMALAAGVRVVPHVWGTGVAIAAALQYLALLPPDPPRHQPREPWLEFDRTENPFRQAILGKPIRPEWGRVAVPDGPGLGIEIDREMLARYRRASR